MPSTGAPGNIWYPDDTSPVAPLENLFLTQATSINVAMAAVGVPRLADLAALYALSGALGDAYVIKEGGALFVHDGVKFVQRTPAAFSATSARLSAYAKGSGAFLVDGASAVVANEPTVYFGSTWRPEQPFAEAAGVLLAASNTTGNTAITFPTGRFTVPPIVSLVTNNVVVNLALNAQNVTAAGMTIQSYNSGSGSAIPAIGVHWTARQMTAAAAAG